MIKKLLLKIFIPSPDALAKACAQALKQAVNASDKEAAIAKYSTLAKTVTETSDKVAGLLVDGKIDEAEADEVAAMLKPWIEKALEVLV